MVFLDRPSTYKIEPVPEGIVPEAYYLVLGSMMGKYEYQNGIAVNKETGVQISIADLGKRITEAHKAQ